jgi:hypothetical protein
LPVLYVHGEGKSKEGSAGGAIEKLVKEGQTVVALDVRGVGETEPEVPHRGLVEFFKADWKEAFLGLHLRRPLLGTASATSCRSGRRSTKGTAFN